MRINKRYRSFFLVSMLTLLTFIISACGSDGSSGGNTPNTSGKAAEDQQIYLHPVGGRSDLQSIDPALVTEGDSIDAVNLSYTGLVQLNSKLEVVDQLAASHSVAEDGLTWTFKLKPDLKFSDGSPLTSEDVAYSLDRALKPELKSAVSPVYLGLIQDSEKRFAGEIPTLLNHSILTPDKDTVVLKANQKAAYFLQILTYQTSFVVSKKMLEKYGDTFTQHIEEPGMGAGPFRVSKYERGKQIEFVPNEHYYGPKPQLKKVVMVFFKEASTVFRAYQSDQVHWSYVPSAQIDAAKQLSDNQFRTIPRLTVLYYTMNYLVKPFNNIKVRQAFALALDKDAIAKNVYKGSVIPTNHVVPEGIPGYNPDLTGPQGVKGLNGDAEMAKKLLAEGLAEEGMTLDKLPQLTMTYSSQGSADIKNEIAATQQMWKNNLGIDIKFDDVDFNKLLEERTRSLNNPDGMQMYRLSWGSDYPDPQNWLTLLFNKGSTKNAFNYGQNESKVAAQQQANQQLMEQADVNQNQEERLKQYQQAEQALIEDVAWIPLYQDSDALVRKPCVTGVVDNAQGFIHPDAWANIYISDSPDCANTAPYK